MDTHFFEQPILNRSNEDPSRHWGLDDQGQPTRRIIESRRQARYITPIPKPRTRRGPDRNADPRARNGEGRSDAEAV